MKFWLVFGFQKAYPDRLCNFITTLPVKVTPKTLDLFKTLLVITVIIYNIIYNKNMQITIGSLNYYAKNG